MKKTIHFTQTRIRDLTIPEKGRVEYYDDKAPKLMCRVSSTGHKTFNVVKWADGKMQRVTLGAATDMTVDEARTRTMEVLIDIGRGIKPIEEKRKRSAKKATLAKCLEDAIADSDIRDITKHGYNYVAQTYFKSWLNKPVDSITKDMVKKKFRDLTTIGNTTANNSMRVLRKAMLHAVESGILTESPTAILNKGNGMWHKNKRKKRIIPSAELQAWHKAVEALPSEKAKVYLLMLIYMGFRSSEVINMRWENVNLRSKTITVLDTKNHNDHVMPIPKVLITYIKELKILTGNSVWVFPNEEGDKPMWLPKKPIAAVVMASGVEFSPHDCRRTFATIAEAVSIPMSMVKRLLNHVVADEDVTGGYIVTEEATLREAVGKVAGYIQARVAQKDNVIQLHKN